MRYGEKLTMLWWMRTIRNLGWASYRRTSRLRWAALRLTAQHQLIDMAGYRKPA